ncbi:unnamed protein product [Callosobruchus maculatus]|uniref:Protein odr-4 homolog n=2 Tax=Callosobruchus maculatus TaxID=64391 RepID=A0A653BR23_CALMS|nr:unnamed protein product [Callosobruchus maculatus]
MVRSIVANYNLQTFFTSTSKDDPGAIGLIIGQSGTDKDYVLYLAKLPFKYDKSSFGDIDENLILDHAKQITRMLPGGMNVLGIAVAHLEDLTSPLHPKLRHISSNLYKTLDSNRYFHGNHNQGNIILNYSLKTQKYICKEYNISNANLQSVDFKFSPKELKWNRIDCTLLIDEIYYLDKEEVNASLEEHIRAILNQIQEKLNNIQFLIDNQYKNEDDCIETYFKKKINKRGSKKDETDEDKPLEAVALLNHDFSSSLYMHQVVDSSGSLKMSGKIVSRIWVQPKMTLAEVSRFLKQDIICSLAARCEMHIDSLTEEENSEEISCIHEPPRRVMVSLPDIEPMFSDYLFPGEGQLDAKASVEELLDVKLKGKLNIEDLEGQADFTKYYDDSAQTTTSDNVIKLQSESSGKIMNTPILLAVAVLLISFLMYIYI